MPGGCAPEAPDVRESAITEESACDYYRELDEVHGKLDRKMPRAFHYVYGRHPKYEVYMKLAH